MVQLTGLESDISHLEDECIRDILQLHGMRTILYYESETFNRRVESATNSQKNDS
jgi:hypothetical protein